MILRFEVRIRSIKFCPMDVDQFLSGVHGQHREGVGRDEQVIPEVVDLVLEGDIHFEQVHVARQDGEVDRIACLAGYLVPSNPLDLVDIGLFDDRDAVVHSGADARMHHLAEPGAHALLLFLDDVQPAGHRKPMMTAATVPAMIRRWCSCKKSNTA